MSPKPPVERQNWKSGSPTPIDPEVEAQLGEREKRRRLERKKARPRATYDLPEDLIAWVVKLSDAESVPRGAIAELALRRFQAEYEAGRVDLESYRVPSDSLRFQWTLEIPEKLFVDK